MAHWPFSAGRPVNRLAVGYAQERGGRDALERGVLPPHDHRVNVREADVSALARLKSRADKAKRFLRVDGTDPGAENINAPGFVHELADCDFRTRSRVRTPDHNP